MGRARAGAGFPELAAGRRAPEQLACFRAPLPGVEPHPTVR